jgi:hypothetical protein
MLSFGVGVVHFAIIASQEIEIIGCGWFSNSE